ncbi:MAG: flavodoxin family protein [Candidatus Methanoplasma sp.]|nr:flavodoxin family protein [Candidatus Methanoplasma sp.]
MSIIAIVSGPRDGGNSDTIVQAITKGANEKGKDVKTFRLNQMRNVRGCQACMACKKTGRCAVDDDYGKVLEEIRGSEGIILSTPFYFGDSCGQFRLFQDRFYSFMGADSKPNLPPGKKVAVVVTCGGDRPGASAVADKIEGVMVGALGFEPVGKIVFVGGPPTAAANDGRVLSEAAALGRAF